MESTYLIENFVSVTAGSPFRIFPFGVIYKNGVKREITPEFAKQIKLPHFKPPIKLSSHDDNTPAGGFVVGLEVKEDGLYAVPEWNEAGLKAIQEGAYRYNSPEIMWGDGAIEDPKTGNMISGPMLLGTALLHTPHLGEAAALYSVEAVKVDKFEMTPEAQSIIDACKACMQACTDCLVACSTCPNADDANHRSCISACKQCIETCADCIRRCTAGDMSACQWCMDCCSMCTKCCEDCGASCADCKASCDACMDSCKACVAACSIGATNNMSAEPKKKEKKMEENITLPKSFYDKFIAPLFAKEPQVVKEPEDYAAVKQENEQYKAQIESAKKAEERKARVDKFDAELKETKADPALSDLLADLPEEKAEAIMKQFKALSEQINESALTGERGVEGAAVDDPKAAFNAAVLAISADKKITYNAAFEEAKVSHADLFSAAFAKK